MTFNYNIYPLGDAAIMIDFGNVICQKINQQCLGIRNYLLKKSIPEIQEIVCAYSSVAIYYRSGENHHQNTYDKLKKILEEANTQSPDVMKSKTIDIPVWYTTQQTDLMWLAQHNNTTVEHLIEEHSAIVYYVYMLGFLPGFPYMGDVKESIVAPRKKLPVLTRAGSVGIAGRQTGIYPIDSPGGWQIIGKSPVTLFDSNNNQPTLLQAGDFVRFIPITQDEYKNYQSRD